MGESEQTNPEPAVDTQQHLEEFLGEKQLSPRGVGVSKAFFASGKRHAEKHRRPFQ